MQEIEHAGILNLFKSQALAIYVMSNQQKCK